MIVVDSFLQVPLDGADKYLVTSSIARAPNRSRRYPRNIPGVARGNTKFCSGGARSIPGPAGRGLRYYIISYDVAGVFNVIKTSNVAIPWIENRLLFSVVGFGFTWLPIGC